MKYRTMFFIMAVAFVMMTFIMVFSGDVKYAWIPIMFGALAVYIGLGTKN